MSNVLLYSMVPLTRPYQSSHYVKSSEHERRQMPLSLRVFNAIKGQSLYCNVILVLCNSNGSNELCWSAVSWHRVNASTHWHRILITTVHSLNDWGPVNDVVEGVSHYPWWSDPVAIPQHTLFNSFQVSFSILYTYTAHIYHVYLLSWSVGCM